jgi:hypothetical protein
MHVIMKAQKSLPCYLQAGNPRKQAVQIKELKAEPMEGLRTSSRRSMSQFKPSGR